MDKRILIMLSDGTYDRWKNHIEKYQSERISSLDQLLSRSYVKKPVLITESNEISDVEINVISKSSITLIIGESGSNETLSEKYQETFCILSEDLPSTTVSVLINLALEQSCRGLESDTDDVNKTDICCAVIESVPDAIIIRNRKGDYVDIIADKDREHDMIFGNIEKMIGKNVKDVLNLRTAEEFIRVTNEVLDTNTRAEYEYELMLEGKKRHVLSYIAPINGSDMVVWLARDISQIYNDKTYLKSILDNRIDIINNLNHEVRTPLNYVTGTLETIDSLCSESIGDKITKMKRSIDQIKNVLGKLVDFNNILQDNVSIHKEDFDLYKLIEVLSSKYIVKCFDKKIKFNTIIDNNMPRYYYGDKDLILKCLDILLDNAWKFTEEGEVNLSVKYEKEELKFLVEDTGVGIEKDKINSIFYEFIQEDLSPTKSYGGIGIGLSVLTGLLKLIEGKFGLKSKKGIGTKFDIRIPVEEINSQRIIKSNKAFLGKIAIVVDDDKISRNILEITLKNLGFEVMTFVDGLSVLEYLNSELPKIDLIVVDWNIPKMDGFDIAKRIRELNDYVDISIILVTSFFNDKLQSLCKEAGIDSYIYKPIDNSQLNDLLHKIFSEEDNAVVKKAVEKYPGAFVMVIDDSVLNTEMLGNYLKELDIKTEVFNQGFEAIKSLDKNDYDLAIIDVEMGVLNGFECSERIRKIVNDMPIIMMSANDEEVLSTKLKKYNINGFVAKPIDVQTLNKRLSCYLSAYQVNEQKHGNNEDNSALNIEWIDVSKALSRFHGNKQLFLKSLENFVLGYEDERDCIIKSLLEREYGMLKECVHKLKGHSGNLSINSIYKWCIQSEAFIENEEYFLIDISNNDKTIESIKSFFQQYQSHEKTNVKAISDEEAIILKDNMLVALKKRNVKEISMYVDDIENSDHPYFKEYDWIIKNIKKYKYKDAIKLIMEGD